jgi:hypothetical protein
MSQDVIGNIASSSIRDSIFSEDQMRMGSGCQEEKTGMRIADLLAALPAEEHYGAGAGDVTSVAYESDAVTPGACFVAIRGHRRCAGAGRDAGGW